MFIEVLHNGKVIETKEFSEGSWKIGRSSDCDLRLKSNQVSKQHALLVIKGNRAAIVDMGSSNGVFVNGILVRKQRIEMGDEVTIVDFTIRLAKLSSRRASPRPQPESEFNSREPQAFDGNAALDLNYDPLAAPAVAAAPTPEPESTPQEKLLQMVDKKLLLPLYELMKTLDWRWILSFILIGALVASVFLSVFPIVRWGKTVTSKEALERAHTILAQTVRENYRTLSKTNDYTGLSVESCESAKGILACYIIDPATSTVLSPVKLFNKSVTEVYAILAMQRIKEAKSAEKSDEISIERDDGTWMIAQPIYLYPESSSRQLSAIVLANFEISQSLASTFEPLVEAALFAILISLAAYFIIFKLVTYPIGQLQEQLDAALKGENVVIQCESKFSELESLAQQINFSVSRLRQAGGGTIGAVEANDPEAEDNAYIAAVKGFDVGTTDGLILLDREKKVRFVGKAIEDMLSMRNQYAQGQNISDACKDPAVAGTCIDLAEQVFSTLGEPQNAQLDINGINRQISAVGSKNSAGEVRFVLVTVKLGGGG